MRNFVNPSILCFKFHATRVSDPQINCNISTRVKSLYYREEEEEDAPQGFGQVPPLLKLLKCRSGEVEKCNMLLLLLAAGLEFSLPLSLIDETLHTANLDNIGGVSCVTLLQLPHEDLLLTASVLLR